jgi:hypothetical protein
LILSSRQHEAASTTPAAYLPSPTLSADTRPSTSDHSLSSPLPLVKRAKNEKHFRVIDLFDKWYARQSGPFTEDSLAPFRAFCENELIRLGHMDASRLFSKQPKAIVGTQVSRADRLHQRHSQTRTIFVCPLSGCGAQCTRRHNLNRESHPMPIIYMSLNPVLSVHLGAHIGLTDRYCQGCGAYFSASSINRHKETCSGKKNQHPRKRYGERV